MTRVRLAWAVSALILVTGYAWGVSVGYQSDAGTRPGDVGILGWGLLVAFLVSLVVSVVLTSRATRRR